MRPNIISYARLIEMKTMFTKLMKHAPVNGWMAICQRDSRFLGNRGMKF
jgi:hypothetical protein